MQRHFHLFLLSLFVIVSACDTSQETSLPNANVASATSLGIGSHINISEFDKVFHALASVYPNFAGAFINDGIILIQITDEVNVTELLSTFSDIYDGTSYANYPLETIIVQNSYQDLYDASIAIQNRTELEGTWSYVQIDVMLNRVTVGVLETRKAEFHQHLSLPIGDLNIEYVPEGEEFGIGQVPRVNYNSSIAPTIREYTLPIRGGSRLLYNISGGTGDVANNSFVVKYVLIEPNELVSGMRFGTTMTNPLASVDRFGTMTNSHASIDIGVIDGTQYYQRVPGGSAALIGSEVYDPPFSDLNGKEPDCPTDALCRYSDANIIAFDVNIPQSHYSFGTVHRTDALGSINLANPVPEYFDIFANQDEIGPIIPGQSVEIMDSQTGWSQGIANAFGTLIYIDGQSEYRFITQLTIKGWACASASSGSTVFSPKSTHGDDDIVAIGMHMGRSGNLCYASTFQSIHEEFAAAYAIGVFTH